MISDETIQRCYDFFTEAEQKALAQIKARLPLENDPLPLCIEKLLADKKRFEALDGETRQILCGHLHLEARLDPIFRIIAQEPRLLQVLNTIFEDRPLRLHLPPAARFILPHNHYAGVPPHQDLSYNQHLDDFVTTWVPFVPIDDACGGVGVYHGTGSSAPQDVDHSQVFWNKPVTVQEESLIHCKVQPGDVLLLNPSVIHRSMANTSTRTRYSTDFRFFAAPAKSRKHYLDLETGQVVAPGPTPGRI